MEVRLELTTSELRNDVDSFRALGQLHHELSLFQNQAIDIDLGRLLWFDAHLSGPLKSIILQSVARGNSHRLLIKRDDIRDILSKNGLLKRKMADVYGTTMPLQEFGLNAHKEFAVYAKRNLSRREMPRMTQQLQRKFLEGVDELFANSSMHSLSPVDVVVAGQVYPRKHLLTISLSDGGIGIIGSLRKAGITFRNHAEAIHWAMQRHNTSRQGDIPGGLGLSVLQEFISMNGGKLLIASKQGFWCQNGQAVQTGKLDYDYPGSCVIIEINTADQKSYDLVSPVSAQNIW